MPRANPNKQLQHWIYDALVDAKAQDITALDVHKVSDFTDTMIVVTGTSNRHVSSVADKVVDALRTHGVRPVGVEGLEVGDWVLIDFGSAVVHVMRQQIRDFYNLEKLWGESKALDLAKPKPVARKRVKKKAATGRGGN